MDTVSQFLVGCLFLPVMLLVASTDTGADRPQPAPFVEILGGPDLYVSLGAQLNLTCVVAHQRGEPWSDPGWLHAGTEVIPSASTRIEAAPLSVGSWRSSLVKASAEKADEGVYACVAGAAANTATATVHVLPEASAAEGGAEVRRPVATLLSDLHPFGDCANSRAEGEEWREDPCTTCRCEGGRKKCHAYMCRASCINPRHVPGECCPVCDSTSVVTLPPHCPSVTHCPLKCPQGFVKDKDGCFRCSCQAEDCQLECPHGFKSDVFGNQLCQCAASSLAGCPSLSSCRKNCTHGLHTGRRGCPVCKCHKCRRMLFSSPVHEDGPLDGGGTGSLIKSTSHGILLLCPGPCIHGYMVDDRGCPTCWCNEPPHSSEGITPLYAEEVTKAALSCLLADGSKKSSDDVWWSGCRKCRCIEGVESCSTASCPSAPPVACDHTIIINGHCCPVCTESRSLIALIVLCALVLVALVIVIAVRFRHYTWWPQRRCLRFGDEDGGVRVLGASRSPTDSPGPQANGMIKYDIPAMPLGGGTGSIKAMRRSGEYYDSVPRYEPPLGDCEKSALAPL